MNPYDILNSANKALSSGDYSTSRGFLALFAEWNRSEVSPRWEDYRSSLCHRFHGIWERFDSVSPIPFSGV